MQELELGEKYSHMWNIKYLTQKFIFYNPGSREHALRQVG